MPCFSENHSSRLTAIFTHIFLTIALLLPLLPEHDKNVPSISRPRGDHGEELDGKI